MEVHHLTLQDDGNTYERRPRPNGVREIEWAPLAGKGSLEPSQWAGQLHRFRQLLADINPELIHAGPIQSGAWLAAQSGFHPFVAVSWGSDLLVDADRDAVWRAASEFVLHRADRLICDATAVREKALSLGCSANRILQFPWGVDLEAIDAHSPKDMRISLGWQEAKIVLSTRTWEPIYGVDLALEAFSRAHARERSLRLVLLGSGSQESSIKRRIRELGLSDVVACPGRVENPVILDFLSSADVYLSCSHSDGSSISLLEAMAVGLPVVATDLPANREWIDPSRQGWLARVGDVEGFAEHLLTAVSLPLQLAREMRDANLARVRADANWRKSAARMVAAYRALAASSPFPNLTPT